MQNLKSVGATVIEFRLFNRILKKKKEKNMNYPSIISGLSHVITYFKEAIYELCVQCHLSHNCYLEIVYTVCSIFYKDNH